MLDKRPEGRDDAAVAGQKTEYVGVERQAADSGRGERREADGTDRHPCAVTSGPRQNAGDQ